jgi:hypothetical protein
VTGSVSWLCRSSRVDLWLVAEELDTLDLEAGLGVLEEFGSIKLRGGVMMRITLDILDLANLGETVPPRDPDDDDEAEDEEDDERDEDRDPAVIREPDE